MEEQTQTDNPNILSNEQIDQEIVGLKNADPGLKQIMDKLVRDSDAKSDVGIRLRAKNTIPRLNGVLVSMRAEGLDMDWPTIQLKLSLKVDEEIGDKYGQTLSTEEYKWTDLRGVVNVIRTGLDRKSEWFDPNEKF